MVKTPIDYAAQISPEEARRIITAASAVYDPERLKGIFGSPKMLAYAVMELQGRRIEGTSMYGPAGSTLTSLTAIVIQERYEQDRKRDLTIINVLEEAHLP